MFKELLGIFGPKNPFEAMGDTFMAAFRSAVDVFSIAHEAAWSGDTSEETARRIYDLDVTVNQTEREVRKMVVRHLSVQQGLDILYCLRLMSLVKDVERIGDYGKNLFEIGELRVGEFDEGELRGRMRAYGEDTLTYLRRAVKVFEASDEPAAAETIHRGKQLMSHGEELVKASVHHAGSANTAACFALMARHYKRAVGHSTNVLTGLTMPIHALDYFDEKLRP